MDLSPLDNRFDLGFFPTPLQHLKRLSKQFDNYDIYIKRDDNTGLASGGNKTRKLEYLIQDAIDSGCDTIITGGAQQSNHCRQTAAACSSAELECHLCLGGDKPDGLDGNLLLSHLLGANIHFTGANRKGEDMLSLKQELEDIGRRPYIVPYGGSNFIGALGFVQAVKELQEQISSQAVSIDFIFFASSSAGTQAGFMLGKEIFGLEAELVPISIDKTESENNKIRQTVLDLVSEGSQKLGLNKSYSLEDIPLILDYDGAGYGIVTDNERNAIRLLARTEGILVDPVYTGRAFHGMIDMLEKNRISANKNVLFWHTGGLPALFSHASKFKLD